MILRVTSPYDGETVAELPYDGDESLERKLVAARGAFESWRAKPLDVRIAQVRSCLGYFRDHGETIARDVTRQMGKPIGEARRELETFFERAESLLDTAPLALAPDILPAKPGFHRRIEHVPMGVVLDLAAWNYPLLIPVNVVVPALLAGNAVLLKHSARTPLVGAHFERAFAALEDGSLVTHLVVTHAAAATVVRDPRVDHVSFTGSVEGGVQIYREAAHRIVDVGLELGGKDPAYIAEDADLESAVANVVDGACYNAGQSCCAVERVYVHRTHYEAFLALARPLLTAYRLGDPLDESTTMGPLALPSTVTLLQRQVEDAVRRGARVLVGGRVPEGLPGNFFLPTLLAEVPNDAEVMQNESFGPIVAVQSVADDDEAIVRMQDTRYGLTASVWTRSRERAERFAHVIDAGTVYQNRCDYLDPALPWSGMRDSGLGSTLSRYGFLQLTRRKSIHFRLA